MARGEKKPKRSSARIAEYRKRLTERGFKRVEVYVRPEQAATIQYLAAQLRAGSVVSVSPPATSDVGPVASPNSKERIMDTVSTPWTVVSLKAALEASEDLAPGEFSLSIDDGAAQVLEVAVESAGGLVCYLAIQGEQIITTTILWPVEEQEDPAAFEAMMLRRHKVFLPLSALSIDTIDGHDYYELFGSMSARSVLPSVIMEIRTLANNALDLARDLGPAAAA